MNNQMVIMSVSVLWLSLGNSCSAQEVETSKLVVDVSDDDQELPVEGVSIRVAERFPPENDLKAIVQEERTDKHGRASFERLRHGEYLITVLEAPDKFAIETLPVFNLTKNDTIEIKLPPATSVSGTITLADPSSTTLLGVRALQRNGRNRIMTLAVHPDADGKYRIDRLSARVEVSIMARAEGSHARQKVVTLEAGKVTEDVDITLYPIDSSIISGRIEVRLGGNPVATKAVAVTSLEEIQGSFVTAGGTTDGDGRLQVLDLPAGSYKVQVINLTGKGELADFPEKTIEVISGQTNDVLFDIP